MDEGQPGYPRPVGKWWFGCDEINFKTASRPGGSKLGVERPHANDRQADLLDAGKSNFPNSNFTIQRYDMQGKMMLYNIVNS